MTEYSPAETGEYPRIFPNFENCARCEKDLKDNKDNSLHLRRKYARIFVLGHYLFLVPHSFPWASLSENCSLLGTDMSADKYLSIFSPQMEAIVYLYHAWFLGFFQSIFLYFGGVCNKTIIPFALVGYEIGYSQLGPKGPIGYLPSHIQRALME